MDFLFSFLTYCKSQSKGRRNWKYTGNPKERFSLLGHLNTRRIGEQTRYLDIKLPCSTRCNVEFSLHKSWNLSVPRMRRHLLSYAVTLSSKKNWILGPDYTGSLQAFLCSGFKFRRKMFVVLFGVELSQRDAIIQVPTKICYLQGCQTSFPKRKTFKTKLFACMLKLITPRK